MVAWEIGRYSCATVPVIFCLELILATVLFTAALLKLCFMLAIGCVRQPSLTVSVGLPSAPLLGNAGPRSSTVLVGASVLISGTGGRSAVAGRDWFSPLPRL